MDFWTRFRYIRYNGISFDGFLGEGGLLILFIVFLVIIEKWVEFDGESGGFIMGL